MRIAVAGAGIAGLTAAVALARAGFAVEVFERAEILEEVGAGIQLSPNATRALDRLGLLPRLASAAVEPEAVRIRDGRTGRVLGHVPLGATARERYGFPYWTIHRADLQASLIEAVRAESAVALRLGAPVAAVAASDGRVRVTAGGVDGAFDLVIGADGVGSPLRTSVLGHPGAVETGRTAWRASLAREAAPPFLQAPVTDLWLAPGAHVVHYLVRGGAELNVVAIAGRGTDGPPLEGFSPDLRAALSSGAAWTRWPLRVVDPRPAWTRGRTALIGDAAHAMPPSAAQGGAQAIEDAVTLAEALAAWPQNPEAALGRWERARRPRVLRIVREAERNLAIYGLRGPAATARNAALRWTPARLHLARLDWLYGFTGA